MLLIITCSLFFVLYVLLFLYYIYGWSATRTFHPPREFIPATRISVIIAARNEEHNIAACVQSILQQQYPADLLELIIVDDHSTDATALIASRWKQVRVIALQDFIQAGEQVISFKKKALSTGITHSSGTLIVTTDADCIAAPGWLLHIAALYESEHPQLIVAPVAYSSNSSLVQVFQSLDFMTMQGITAATLTLDLGIMCNGANLAFTRHAFEQVKGYDGVDHIVSGDDYLLMMKIRQQFPAAIRYLKTQEAIITTAPQPDWPSFLRQRIRWASKTGKYKDHKMTFILSAVYLFNVSLLLLFIAFCCGTAFSGQLLLFFFLVKVLLETCFLAGVSRFFRHRRQLLVFPLLQPLHIFYIIVAGFLSVIGKYSWKDRNIQQP